MLPFWHWKFLMLEWRWELPRNWTRAHRLGSKEQAGQEGSWILLWTCSHNRIVGQPVRESAPDPPLLSGQVKLRLRADQPQPPPGQRQRQRRRLHGEEQQPQGVRQQRMKTFVSAKNRSTSPKEPNLISSRINVESLKRVMTCSYSQTLPGNFQSRQTQLQHKQESVSRVRQIWMQLNCQMSDFNEKITMIIGNIGH